MHKLPVLLVSSLITAAFANAAGFYLSEVGTPGSLGTGGVANPVNTQGADSSYTNPAAMTGLDGEQALLGAQVLVPFMRFEADGTTTIDGSNGGNAGEAVAIPSAFYARPFNDKLWGGFSVAGTMGGGADYGSDFVGRYGAVEVELATLAISPSLGLEISERLSVGAGVSILYTTFSQEVAIKSPLPFGSDGAVRFDDMDDWGYQPFLGLTYEINERTLFGLVYRAEADVELEGDLQFRGLPVNPPVNDLSLEWDNPQWLEVGLRYQLNDEWTGAINLGWQEWSAFSENFISVPAGSTEPTVLDRGWDDTWHAGVAISRRGERHQWSLGFSYESSPVEDDKRTIDFPVDEQFKFSGSYGWQINEKWDMALGGTLILFGDATVRQETQGELLEGEFSTNVIAIAGGTFRYHF